NWWIDGTDTGIAATGPAGAQGPEGPQGPPGNDGVVDPKNLTADDNSITVTNGIGATIIDASVKVTDGGITTAKIADGAVTTAKIQGDGNDKVLTTDASGNPVWIDKDEFDAIEPWNVQG